MSMGQDTPPPDFANRPGYTGTERKNLTPRIALQYESPHELLEFVSDQISTLEIEINEWEERLYRLRTCRDGLAQAAQWLNEVLQQPQVAPTMPGYR